MSIEEAKKEIIAIRRACRAIFKSRATTRAFLLKYGFITPEGKLAKRYSG